MGEMICCRFLARQGFNIIARNYRKKWGEIDIIATKDAVLHFIEVKSVSRKGEWRPEENVHQAKRARLRRTIMTFLAEIYRDAGADTAFVFHVLAVRIDVKQKKSRISWIEHVVL